MSSAGRAISLVGAALLVGCARYHPQPITDDAVARALTSNVVSGEEISPDEAAILAVIVNPDLRAERDRKKLAEAQVLQAGLLPNPQLTGGIDWPFAGPDH